MLSKKHYVEIALILKNADILLVDRFADYFQKDNPRFDREKFLKACRGEQK